MHYSQSTNAFYPDSLRIRYEKAGNWPADAVEVTAEEYATYSQGQAPSGMQRGSDKEGRPTWVPMPLPELADLAARKLASIESSRKAAESEGVEINGIRYAGDPGNRQAIREALENAEDKGIDTFKRWKDSDDKFHLDHPVSDVWDALRAIAERRSELIDREGELANQINDALEAEDREALEAIEWSEE